MIISMFSIFVIFAIYSYVTLEISMQEFKNLSGLRNEAQANNVMQDLDKYIEKRINDFKLLSNIKEIRDALNKSNEQFSKLDNIEFLLKKRESESLYSTSNTPFMKDVLENQISEDFRKIISFYKNEYDYDVVQELFITNNYGANVALGSGTSDYLQDDEEWWKISKSDGEYIGEINYEPSYGHYSIPFGFRITDESGNFLGVMRVSLSVDDLLHEFINDAEVVGSAFKNVVLLDKEGRVIYSNGIKIFPTSNSVDYFEKIVGDNGFFELKDNNNTVIVSYSRSIGYENFHGFGWIVIISQDQSSVVNEFRDINTSILTASIIGIMASIVVGLIISFLVSSPLQQLSQMAKRISEGNFDVKVTRSKINEIGVIDDSFNNMVVSLKKSIETEKELTETRMRIRKERLSAIGELAASVAHDIKNPLSTIKTSAEILNRNLKDSDKEMAEIIARMNRAIDRISHQIEDVLNFVRITPLEIKPVSIQSILNSTVKSIEIPKNITIDLPKNDYVVHGEQRKLEVIFINLILNSVQAIGNNVGKIIIRLKEQTDDIIIEIEDSGSGIPDELLSKIFFPLVTTKEKGTGLGLSTCKNIIEQHGGTISAKNNPTTFTIVFPKNLKSPKF